MIAYRKESEKTNKVWKDEGRVSDTYAHIVTCLQYIYTYTWTWFQFNIYNNNSLMIVIKTSMHKQAFQISFNCSDLPHNIETSIYSKTEMSLTLSHAHMLV